MDNNVNFNAQNQFEQIDSKNIQNKIEQKEQERRRHEELQQRSKQIKDGKKWSNRDKLRYLIFLTNYKSTLKSTDLIQKHGIYNKMSRFIETKTRDVCLKYHFKMMRLHKNIEGAIIYLETILNLSEKETQSQLQRMEQLIKRHCQKQYNILDMNKVNGFIQNETINQSLGKKQTTKLSTIDSQNESAKISNQQFNSKQQKIQTQKKKYLDIEIPLYAKFTIEKQLINQIKYETPQKTQKCNQTEQEKTNIIQLVESSQVLRKNILSDEKFMLKKRKKSMKKQKILQKTNRQTYKKLICKQENNEAIYYQPQSQEVLKQQKNQEYSEQLQSQQNQEKLNHEVEQKHCQALVESQNNQQNEQQVKFEKICEKKRYEKKKIDTTKIWTMYENAKFILFLNIYRQIFESGSHNQKNGIICKLAQFIGTDKNRDQCWGHLNMYKIRYNYGMSQLIKQQTKNLNILPQLIEQYKSAYKSNNLQKISLAQYEIKFQTQKIEHKTNTKSDEFDINQALNLQTSPQITLIVEQKNSLANGSSLDFGIQLKDTEKLVQKTENEFQNESSNQSLSQKQNQKRRENIKFLRNEDKQSREKMQFSQGEENSISILNVSNFEQTNKVFTSSQMILKDNLCKNNSEHQIQIKNSIKKIQYAMKISSQKFETLMKLFKSMMVESQKDFQVIQFAENILTFQKKINQPVRIVFTDDQDKPRL